MRLLLALMLAASAAPAAPAAASAGVYASEGCKVVTPAGWSISKSRAASPDKAMWAELLSAGSSAEIVPIESNLKAVKLSEDARMILMVSTASYGGKTNKLFHAITKTTPSCVADVAARAGPLEAIAKAVALSVRFAK